MYTDIGTKPPRLLLKPEMIENIILGLFGLGVRQMPRIALLGNKILELTAVMVPTFSLNYEDPPEVLFIYLYF